MMSEMQCTITGRHRLAKDKLDTLGFTSKTTMPTHVGAGETIDVPAGQVIGINPHPWVPWGDGDRYTAPSTENVFLLETQEMVKITGPAYIYGPAVNKRTVVKDKINGTNFKFRLFMLFVAFMLGFLTWMPLSEAAHVHILLKILYGLVGAAFTIASLGVAIFMKFQSVEGIVHTAFDVGAKSYTSSDRRMAAA